MYFTSRTNRAPWIRCTAERNRKPQAHAWIPALGFLTPILEPVMLRIASAAVPSFEYASKAPAAPSLDKMCYKDTGGKHKSRPSRQFPVRDSCPHHLVKQIASAASPPPHSNYITEFQTQTPLLRATLESEDLG